MSATKYPEKGPPSPSVDMGTDDEVAQEASTEIISESQSLHRKLRGKEVQLFAIGGAIGTCMPPMPSSARLISAAVILQFFRALGQTN
jgi:amino acid transporter